ncbi:MAG: hypothetical protein ACOY0R_00990 [Chloroflexota bacterium]
MKRAIKAGPTQAEIRFLVLAFLAITLVLSAFMAANVYAARGLAEGGGILLFWKAVRAGVHLEAGEPYGGGTVHFVQQQVYGRSAQPGENPYIPDLPFPLLLLYAPLGLFPDPVLARGAYLLLSEIGLLLLAYMSLNLAEWQPHRLFTILFYAFAALGIYSLLALREGSPVILMGVFYAGILLALRLGLDDVAGALLVLSFSHWEWGAPFVLLVLARVLAQKRWRVLYSFLLILALLTVIAFFVYPGWVFPWVVGVFGNWSVDFGITPGEIFQRWQPESGFRLGWGLTAVSLVILAFEWAAGRAAEFRRFYWTACLTLALTPLLGMRSALENLALLIPAAALIFAVARERWRAGYWLTVSLLLAFLVIPWALFFGVFLEASLRRELLFLFMPVVTVIGLYWIRWWAIRPPRTWTERVTRPEYR